MAKPTPPAIPAAGTQAAAQPARAVPDVSNRHSREVAACFGECCVKRGRCTVYRGVEAPGQSRFIATCRTPEGAYPLFNAIEPRRRTDVAPVDGEGSEVD